MKTTGWSWNKVVITVTMFLVIFVYTGFLGYMAGQYNQEQSKRLEAKSNCLNCGSQFVIVTVTPSPVPTEMDKWCATVTVAQYNKYMSKADCECDNEKNVKKVTSDLGLIGGKHDYYEHWVVGKAEDYYGEASSIAFNCLLTPTAGEMVDEAEIRKAECELRWFLKKTDWDDMEAGKSNYWDNINELQKRYDILSDYYNLSIQRLDCPPFRDGNSNQKARYNNITYISGHINDLMNEIYARIHQLAIKDGGGAYNKKTDEWEDVYKYKFNEKTRKWTLL
jgi:hypothetical protein